MKAFGLYFSAVLMLCCCSLLHIRGHGVCQRTLKTQINVTTELQSEILLPCLFDSALLTVQSTADWSQINTIVDYIVSIPVKGKASFWNNRNSRIKTFSGGSGNFSILIHDVQRSDLGLYRCEIYRDVNCSLGYKEISLSLVEFSLLNNWPLTVAGGGGFLLLCLVSVCLYCTWTKRKTVDSSVDHGSHVCDSEGQTFTKVNYTSVALKSTHLP